VGQVVPAQSRADPSIVAASVKISNGASGGSGTVIAYSQEQGAAVVLTCRHLFNDGIHTILVTLPSGQRAYGAFLGRADKADLAAVAINADSTTPFIPLATEPLVRGEALTQVGYPLGRGPVVRAGYYQGVGGRDNRGALVHGFSARVQSGDSGSGVFRSDNTLCGVVWGSSNNTSFVGLADIQTFVDQTCHLFRRPGQGRKPPGIPVQPGMPAPLAPVAPVAPAPTAPAPALPDARILAEVSQLRLKIDGLEKIIATLGSVRGSAGPQGLAGPAGPRGSDGSTVDLAGVEKRLDSLESAALGLADKFTSLADKFTLGLEKAGLNIEFRRVPIVP